jgi:hypothetical protein
MRKINKREVTLQTTVSKELAAQIEIEAAKVSLTVSSWIMLVLTAKLFKNENTD